MMMTLTYFVFIYVSVVLSSVRCLPLTLEVGSACFNDDLEGICTPKPKCLEAEEQVKRFAKHNFTRCSFEGFTEIVCCPKNVTVTTKLNTFRKCKQACEGYKKMFSEKLKKIILSYHIAGGTDAQNGEFPHMAALGLYDHKTGLYLFDCGGTLISKKHVLTAAHCKSSVGQLANLKIVRLGVLTVPPFTNVTDPVNDYKVKNITVHPDYKRRKDNDIAIVELEREVKFDVDLRPACLYTEDEVPEIFTITGWGEIDERSTRKTTLQKGTVSLVPFKKCTEIYKTAFDWDISTNNLCAQSNSIDTCQGDSGGPLHLPNSSQFPVLVGVTSFGQNQCRPGFPTTYTKVYKYLDWIEKIVWPEPERL